jgi:hypothetical protein
MISTKAKCLLLWFSLIVATGCSTFSKHSTEANHFLQSGDYEKAIAVLKPLAETDNDDQLVYLLDYGMALHLAGKYKESIQVFLKADDIAAIKDYHSISRIAGSILLNEGMVQYKGDDFEKVFIHVYLALDYLMLDNLDDALVEARRVNTILTKYRDEAKRNYSQNGFATYLSGTMWEADHRWDDAYISYKDSFKLLGDKKIIEKDLIRSAKLAQRSDDVDNWKNKFKKQKVDLAPTGNQGELIFIYQQGKGPVKQPNPAFVRIPKLFPQYSSAEKARVFVNGKGNYDTEELYSVTDVAIQTLDDQYAGLIAKRAAGIAAKYVVSEQLAKKNQALGALAWIGMNLADQADLRQWSNLPNSFQIVRIPLDPGEYEISAQSLNARSDLLNDKMKSIKIKIQSKKKIFLTWRTFS